MALWIASASSFYPGEEGVRDYIDLVSDAGLDFVFGEIGSDAPAWTFWVGLQINTYLYFILTITAILIGSRLVPTREKDAMETLLGSNPQSSRRYYLENIVSASVLLFISMIPSFLILALSSIFNDASDIISRLAIAYIFVFVVSWVFLVGTSMFSILKFSSSTGKKAGFGYLILSFLLEASAGSSDSPEQYANISMNYYVSSTTGLLYGDFDWNPIFVILLIASIFLIISVWRVKYPDYIEYSSTKKNRERGILPTLSPSSKLAIRYPLALEQFRKDFSYFIGWIVTVTFFVLYTMLIFPDEKSLEKVFTSFDTPLVKAMLYNHEPTYDYTGWMLYEFHSINWIYFGLFILLIAASIPNREVRTDSQDIVWGNSIHPSRIIRSRTIVMIAEYTVMLWTIFVSKFVLDMMVGNETSHFREFQVFIIYWIHYISFGFLILSISMLPQVSKGRSISLFVYFYFIFINLLAYSSGIDFLKYFGLFGYIDPAGMMLGLVSFPTELIKSILILGITIISFFLSLKYRYHNADLI
jgi:hypothetical protein